MDKITKALRKLTPKERAVFKALLWKIETGQLTDLDVKKLVGQEDIFRVRKGKYRILFRRTPTGTIFILALERRSDVTYNQY